MSDFHQRIEALSPEKRELLLRSIKKKSNISPTQISPQSRETTIFPLSFAQQRLWFIDQFGVNQSVYNLPFPVRLTGSLNVTALEQSLQEIIRRHEVLRTTFTTVAGQPVQVITSTLTLALPVVDLRELSESERETKVLTLANEEAQRPFNLTQGPLLRTTLLWLDETECVVLFTMHHIISDGWSMGVLIRELAALYEAFSVGKPSPLPELPIQYADFAVWQRQWLQGEVLDAQLDYWQQRLGGHPPVLRLPTDRPRPAVETFRGATRSFSLTTTLTEALKSLSRNENVTLFMTLLAAFKALLYRYTAQDAILVGTVIANRNRAEIEGLIGFFVNTLVLRTDLGDNPSFREMLERVREVTLGAYAHQDLPFEYLVEKLQPDRHLNHHPLFQVDFVLQNAPMKELKLPGVTLSSLELENRTAKFDLSLDMYETSSGLRGVFEYNTDLFDAATVTQMEKHFCTLLSSIVANPEQRLSDLPLLTANEQQQLLVEWNQTKAIYPKDKCIHELVEVQVEQVPDAVAVVFKDEQLTYQELNARANQLAHYLRKLGVKPEVLIGICTERSLDMIVGLLGILKAGGAYIPLDPAYPKERLASMLSDSQVRLLLTQKKFLVALPAHRARVVCLDTDWGVISEESNENLINQATAKNLTYAIYTSGSTGKPKGVLIQHQSLVNYTEAAIAQYELERGDRILQFASISFDAAAEEIFPCLGRGATLILRTDEMLSSISTFLKTCRDLELTILDLPTAFWHQIVAELSVTGLVLPQSLRLFIIGGEGALPEQLATWQQIVDTKVRLVNSYGPTEATIVATICELSAESLGKELPIGHPVRNVQTYILDPYLQPTPVGVPGELYIGGVGLARGYLNQPDRTAVAFIPNPCSEEPGTRLYKTGDLVRYRRDGNIEFLGRIDHQVKIRGFRVELQEIETVLRQHPSIKETAVSVYEPRKRNSHLIREPLSDRQTQKRLVAYVVQNLQSDGSLEQLAQWNAEYVSKWQTTYDELYSQTSDEQNPTFNIIGWDSTYTGLPISEAEMREWVDHTVGRILSLQPNRVLEIGCGTGLLLCRIVPHCTQYWGTDFSLEVLQRLQRLKMSGDKWSQVTLLQRMADNFDGIEAHAFDTVILNSVIQYFPSIEYLLRVLEGAVNVVEPGGKIFVGDVRSLPLLEVFHTSVQLHQAPASLSSVQLQQRVQQYIAQEQELVIDPAFFLALKQHIPQISHVQIQPKRGDYHNELTKFRYDVTLYVETPVDSTQECPWLDWQEQQLTLASVRQLLESAKPEKLGLRRVPNARVLTDVQALELLNSDLIPDTAGDLEQAVQSSIAESGINPEDLWSLKYELPYDINISWVGAAADGSYDVVFEKHPTKGMLTSFPGEKVRLRSWGSYANNPLQGKFARELVPQLRSYLQEKLPEYMIPGAFVTLPALPITPNGKVDRQALPPPGLSRSALEAGYVAPRTPIEEQLAKIWAEVLGVESVGIQDNFFHLGGHSLLVTQLVFRVWETFQVELPLRSLFEMPTIADLAKNIEAACQTGASTISAKTVVDFKTEAVLDPTIRPERLPVEHTTEPDCIFLTGATGFVGAFLLDELLRQTQADIYCLVRASNLEEGEKRIQTALKSYLRWDESFSPRIISVLGDLSKPLLGLSEKQFLAIASKLDVIYHNGAWVHHASPYSKLKAANVVGTQEVLRLASLTKVKPVHFVSTVGVFSSVDHTGVQIVREQDSLDDYSVPLGGYVQSKWVAEKLVNIARDRGLPVCIYRLGRVSGHSRTGVFNANDFLYKLIIGCIQLGSVPDTEMLEEMAPIDYVSQAIVHLSRQRECLGKNFHLVNSSLLSSSQLIRSIRSFGYPIQQISYEQWHAELVKIAGSSPEHPLYPLVPFFAARGAQEQESHSAMLRFDCQNTLDGLAGTSIVCPPIDDALLNTYFSSLIRSGFLKAPHLTDQ
jgi:amino acid adenylation domain-containing protein/thioester reductase-like protein